MTSYIGRFAPSPTGPLHFGSLLAATASYLEARSQQGHWLLRMEDLDKPREQPGAAGRILKALAAYGFSWDGEVVYQSQRLDAYQAALEQLQPLLLCLPVLTQTVAGARTSWPARPHLSRYLSSPPAKRSTRSSLCHPHPCSGPIILSDDAVQGRYCQQLDQDVGDFVIRRADGLFAYQLAVVIDDAWQGITHVVRVRIYWTTHRASYSCSSVCIIRRPITCTYRSLITCTGKSSANKPRLQPRPPLRPTP
ncbi:MAG: glutamate--tRNA ligase family protein [Thiolinea sp.]